MTSTSNISLFKDASSNIAGAVETLLESTAECASWDRATEPDRHPHYFRAQTAVDEVWKKCFELGVASVKLADEIIAFFSNRNGNYITEGHSSYQSVAQAIEALTARCAELQPAVEGAWRARRTFDISREHYGSRLITESMDIVDEYFGPIEDGKVPPLETRAKELARLWTSLTPKGIEATVLTSEIVSMYQRHIICVCLHWLPVRRHHEPAGSVALDSPLMDRLLRQGMAGREDSVRTLAGFSTQYTWKSKNPIVMLNNDVIGALSSLQSYDFGNLPPDAISTLSELLLRFAEILSSSLAAFASAWAIEQRVHQLNILDIFPLDQDPFAVLQSVPMHRGNTREAITQAGTHLDIVITSLKQLQNNPAVITCQGPLDNSGKPRCIKCTIGNLLAYCEQVLSQDVLHPHGWTWATSELSADKEKINVANDFRNIFITARPYTSSLHSQDFVNPNPEPSANPQIPSSGVESTLDPGQPQLFWLQIFAVTTNLRKHLPLKDIQSKRPALRPGIPKPTYQWKACTCN